MNKTIFGSLPVGAKFKLENCYGVKTEPVVCQASRDFYASQNAPFYDWNVKYQFMGYGAWNGMSLSPETEVELV